MSFFLAMSLCLLVCLVCLCLSLSFSVSVSLLSEFVCLSVCLSPSLLLSVCHQLTHPFHFVLRVFLSFFTIYLIPSVVYLSFPSSRNSIHSSIFVSALSANKALCFYLSRTHRKETSKLCADDGTGQGEKTSNWIASLNQFTSNCDGSVVALPTACPVLQTWRLAPCKLSHRLLWDFPWVVM